MTWFGILVLVMAGISIIRYLIGIGEGGYSTSYSPTELVFLIILTGLMVWGYLAVGTGSL